MVATPMDKKVVIACNGTTALRLIMEFKRVGVKTVAVYTSQDVKSDHLQLADEAICIGHTSKSYSDWSRIISVAEISDADAIHPGDGPLSNHEHFTEVCHETGIKLLGWNK